MNNVARARRRHATHERRSRVLTRKEEEKGENVRVRDGRQARRTDCDRDRETETETENEREWRERKL
jgi:hypothetical protein